MSVTTATQGLLDWPYRALRTEAGRRATAAFVVSLALATTVQILYANADEATLPMGAATRAAERATPASQPADAPAERQAAGSKGGGGDQPATGRPAEREAAAEPGDVAVRWYARERGVPPGKVRLLQQDPKNDNEVRVLVMAEIGDRVDTAVIKVRRGKNGWKVP